MLRANFLSHSLSHYPSGQEYTLNVETSDRQLPVVQRNPHTPIAKPGRATEVGELLMTVRGQPVSWKEMVEAKENGRYRS